MSTTLRYTALSNSGGHTGDGARAEEMKSTGEESNGRRERQTGPFIGPSGPVPERRKSWRAMVNGGANLGGSPRPPSLRKIKDPSAFFKVPCLACLAQSSRLSTSLSTYVQSTIFRASLLLTGCLGAHNYLPHVQASTTLKAPARLRQ